MQYLKATYFLLSGLWAAGMALSSASMLYVSFFDNLNGNPAGFGALEILSVLGMPWIFVSIWIAGTGLKSWGKWICLGHCFYYAGLLIVPSLLYSLCPSAFENSNWRYFLGAAMLYLTGLSIGNFIQAKRLAASL